MRKVLVLIMAVLLGVTAFALAGCGNTAKAKEDMKAADAAWDLVYAKITASITALTQVIGPAMSGDVSAITQNSAVLAKAGETVNVVTKELEDVKKLYDDLANLNVGGYREYADAMIKTINGYIDAITIGKELFNKILPVIQTGDVAQIKTVIEQNMGLLTQAQSAYGTAESDYNAAKKIKTDKKLGQ
jgi:predicted small secreted protein